MKSDNSKIKDVFNDMPFVSKEVKIIESVFHKINVEKGTVLIKAGSIVDFQYFILNGCLRSYHIDAHGKEYTVQFGVKDWWISDFTAFFSSDKAIMTIEVLQTATLYQISKEERDYLFFKIPRIDQFFRIKLEKAFASLQRRVLANLSQNATERYLSFITRYPNIEQNIKNYHIASYIGITTESLSRIRKDLSAS